MGAELWRYVVPYQPNVGTALDELRQSVFAAGSYRGSEQRPPTMQRALDNMEADGTASILDIDHVAKRPEPMGVTVLTPAQTAEYFGTERPTRAHAEDADKLYADIGRGEAVCVTLYDGDR